MCAPAVSNMLMYLSVISENLLLNNESDPESSFYNFSCKIYAILW
jgi:hypothetical protein